MKTKKGIMAVLVALSFGLITSCATTTPKTTPMAVTTPEVTQTQCVPDWVLNPPSAEDGLYGSGSAKMQIQSLSKQTADARARDEIAMAIRTKVQKMMKDFMQQAGIGDGAQALQLAESVSKQISSQVLYGCRIIKRKICSDGTWYSLALWPRDQEAALKKSVTNQTKNLVKNEYALYNEFKAKNGFNELQKELDKVDFTQK